jgi:ABC-type antimicrobial peptide transport system permease subunit
MLLALRLSVQDLLRDRSRTLLSLIGLSVVISGYFILSALSGALSSYLSNTSINRNLIVIQKDVLDASDATIKPEVIEAARDLIPGKVSRISPNNFRHTSLGGHVVQLRASDPQDWEPVYHLVLIKGSWPGDDDLLSSRTGATHESEAQIAAGEGIALTNNWQVGSDVEIFGTQFIISGIFRAPGSAFASVWMPSETFMKLFDIQRGFQSLLVLAAAGVDSEAVRAELENDPRLGGAYAVYFEDDYTQRGLQFLKDLSSLITISSLVALLGITFGIFNAVNLSTAEHGYEIGILLGIGFSQRRVRSFLLVRFTLLGLLAYTVGLAMALLYTTSQQLFNPLFVLGFPLVLQITPGMAFTGFCLVFTLALLSAWVSTRRLFNLQIVELLRER